MDHGHLTTLRAQVAALERTSGMVRPLSVLPFGVDVLDSHLPAYPEALARTVEIADRCRFSLSELRYQYPDEAEVPDEMTNFSFRPSRTG